MRREDIKRVLKKSGQTLVSGNKNVKVANPQTGLLKTSKDIEINIAS